MENHINPTNFTDEQLLAYQLTVQAKIGELSIYNADCQSEWDRRYPPQQQ